jgi:hypothetical protein
MENRNFLNHHPIQKILLTQDKNPVFFIYRALYFQVNLRISNYPDKTKKATMKPQIFSIFVSAII